MGVGGQGRELPLLVVEVSEHRLLQFAHKFHDEICGTGQCSILGESGSPRLFGL